MTPPPNLPAGGYEPIPNHLLVQVKAMGEQCDLQYWDFPSSEWKPFPVSEPLSLIQHSQWVFCAKIGTIAAATTPLPESRHEECPDCDGVGTKPCLFAGQTSCDKCGGKGKLNALRYRHILPGELAKMPTKPEGLLIGAKNRQVHWQPYAAEWPIPSVWAGDFAYAIPLPPQPEKGKGVARPWSDHPIHDEVAKLEPWQRGEAPSPTAGEIDELRELKKKSTDAINFIKTLNAKTHAHGREYRSACGKFLAQLQKLP